MDHSCFLRTRGSRIVGQKKELVSPSFAWRRLKKRQREDMRWNAQKAEVEARKIAHFRKLRHSGTLDRLRAQGLGDIADGYEREMVGID